MGAFHAYDIRGIYGVDFDKETAYKVGYFIPELLGADKVVVGRDCRVSSEEIHDNLVKGICDAGADVYVIGRSGLFGLNEDIEASWNQMVDEFEETTGRKFA